MTRPPMINLPISAIALFGLVFTTATSVRAQDFDSFAVLAGSTVTNTGNTVINGNVGVSPGSAITGFPPGTVNGTIHSNDAAAIQAQIDLINAINTLAARPSTTNLTGQDLGGMTLTAGVYTYNSSANLTGTLTFDAKGNSNAIFIVNIGSSLTTASASSIKLINGASANNVYFVVGSSATLGTTTSFAGHIYALTSITLNTGATIDCGSAAAHNGAVTLDSNTISVCTVAAAGSTSVAAAVSATINVITFVATATAATTTATTATTAAAAATAAQRAQPQLSGEASTGIAQAGTQAMTSFMSMLTNPFDNNRPFAENPIAENRPSGMVVKARGYASESPQSPARAAFASVDRDPYARRWGIWGAVFGGQNTTTGDSVAGIHDRSARTFGYATGFDYRATPYTVVGFALAGGATNYGLSDGLGGGHSNMFQAAVYSTTRVNAAYVSTTLAYAWHHVSTDRYVTLTGNDHLTADFSANNVGGRIEGGYRFAIPGVLDSAGFGVTPYAALQVQAFRTPSYQEIAASGSSIYALAYDARTTTATRTELGSWVDKTYSLDRGYAVSLFGRAAWAHDWYSDLTVTSAFQSLPGVSFIVIGAAPAKDSLLLSAGSELYMLNGWSVMAKFDSELAQHSRTYTGTARLRYTF